MVIFDFDKTLTYSDTLLGFYKAASRNTGLFLVKFLVYLPFIFLYKLKVISNDFLKIIGVEIFLKGKSKPEVEAIGQQYSKKIILNKVYQKYFYGENKIHEKQVIIISASFEVYIKNLFPSDVLIYGSKLRYDSRQKVTGIKENLFGEKKLIFYRKLYPTTNIDLFFTDSLSDKHLAEISNRIIVVQGDKGIPYSDFENFLKHPW